MAEESKKIKVTLVKSLIGTKPEHRACVRDAAFGTADDQHAVAFSRGVSR